MINSTMTSDTHLNARIDKFQRSVYGIGDLGITNHAINATLKSFLLRTYCLPVLLYGCECTYYNKTQLNNTKRCFTVIFKRCLNLNKLLRNDELLYSMGIEPIINLIHRKKINALIFMCKNQTMKKLFNNIINNTNQQQSNSQSKKSFIYECGDILEHTINDIETLLISAEDHIKTIDIDYEIMSNSDDLKEVKWLLEHPSPQNWYQLNQLLIPNSIEHIQSQFWKNILGSMDEPYIEPIEIGENRLNEGMEIDTDGAG
jgi:hypothetical protein